MRAVMPWDTMHKLVNPTQEEWFDIWCEELLEAGYLDEVVTHPDVPTFELFPGYKRPYGKKKNVIMNGVSYTPDRILKWNDKAKGIFFEPFGGENHHWDRSYFNAHKESLKGFYYSIVEVKGPTGNQKAYGQDFKFTQKWLWANSRQYVQKVMMAPVKRLKDPKAFLWASTFTPERYLYTDGLKTNRNKPIPYRTIPTTDGIDKWAVRSLEEFVKQKSSTIT